MYYSIHNGQIYLKDIIMIWEWVVAVPLLGEGVVTVEE